MGQTRRKRRAVYGRERNEGGREKIEGREEREEGGGSNKLVRGKGGGGQER